MKDAYRSDTSICPDVDELTLIAKMRVVLSLATLFTVIVDPNGFGKPHPATMLLFYAYCAQSIVVLLLWQSGRARHYPRLTHWLDVLWFSLLLTITGPLGVFFFLLFFAIATAAFRWGYDEGARVTLASTLLYLLSSLGSISDAVLANVLLRAAFLLALGYMVSSWGEALLVNRRRIALLRDVSRLSNPRFGVDHTIASVLERTRMFFDADVCMVLMRDGATGKWHLRSTRTGSGAVAPSQHLLDEQMAAVLADVVPRSIAVYSDSFVRWAARLHIRDEGSGKWLRASVDTARQLIDLTGARSFACATIPLRKEEGRIFVLSSRPGLKKEDAAFLAEIAAQAFPVIENIALLDRLASDAGRRERQKFSNDLHDTAVQPYIGLSHALQAVLRDAGQDNPVLGQLRQVAEMADSFVRDLRRFASATTNTPASDEPAFMLALRSHAAHFKDYYKLDVTLSGHDALDINDRLGAEVVQLVREGMSNIRRHTAATHAAIGLSRNDGWLHIRIENDCPSGPPAPFTPRSISERAAALGGVAYVGSTDKATAVHVDIPL